MSSSMGPMGTGALAVEKFNVAEMILSLMLWCLIVCLFDLIL